MSKMKRARGEAVKTEGACIASRPDVCVRLQEATDKIGECSRRVQARISNDCRWL